jgi:phosphocarrier protein
MIQTYKVVDEAGLHARPLSLLVQVACKYSNEVNIEFKDKKVTLKSILVAMSLGIPTNAEFSIEVLGDDAEIIQSEMKAILVEHKVI